MANHSEIIKHYDRYLGELMDTPGFYDYSKQVYDYLEMMEPGNIIALQAPSDRIMWLLVVTGAFLAASDHWMDFETNEDYTKVRRRELPKNFRKAMRSE